MLDEIETRAASEFLGKEKYFFLIQHVLDPTFVDNFLDLVFTKDPNRIYKVEVCPPLSASGKNVLHSVLKWEILVENPHSPPLKKETEKRYLFAKTDFLKFERHLRRQNCDSIFSGAYVDEIYDIFTE